MTGSSFLQIEFASTGRATHGFSLTFQGIGDDIPNNHSHYDAPRSYQIYPTKNIDSPSGLINYPSNDPGQTFLATFVSFTVHATRHNPVYLTLNSFSGYKPIDSCASFRHTLIVSDFDRRLLEINGVNSAAPARLRYINIKFFIIQTLIPDLFCDYKL